MCGIAGMVGLPIIGTEKMLETMARRGPDGRGSFQQGECCLLHSRLAIIDLDGGAQPMTYVQGNEKYTITYNGELYNTAELRSRLIALGHQFRTHSDTEVLLHAYAQWGEEALQLVNGIFAFAVWEHHTKRLFVARDRIGVKPLFYTRHKGGFLFASELKTILAYPGVEARLDAQGVAELLLLGPGRKPGSGVFKDIMELEPGCCGVFQDGKWQWKRYWYLKDRTHEESFEETAEHIRMLLTDSIRRQMVSDVPIGCFLSGGLDSSLISAVCAGETAKRGARLNTFSLDYENNRKFFVPGKFQPNTDSDYIPIMENALGVLPHRTVLTPEALVNTLEEATIARDLPGMADVDFSLLAFCKEIRSVVKVALSGECADEIFGGYPWYRDPEVRARSGFPWAQNTAQRADFLHPDIRAQIDPDCFVGDLYQTTLNRCDILPGTLPTEKRMKEMVNLNHHWFMQTLLDRKDRMSMYCGLEVRVPFCDYRIAEYMYAVPWSYKDRAGYEKGLLRHAMQGILPDEILWRKKSPYPKTHDPKYEELVSAMLREVLTDPSAPIFQIVERKALEQLLTAEFTWPWYGQLMKKPQTIAYMLQLNFWLRHYHISFV
ncbi:MAG: asparagine synthase (glutamine-hydrolyzing) [Ruminococcaceae bacterium]|nr:asparagine synthase (glutamine-hydrolyzing) [Oscillospiraceae bacterium]